jgi:senataxin
VFEYRICFDSKVSIEKFSLRTGEAEINRPPGTGKTKTVVGIAGALLTPTAVETAQTPGATKPKPVIPKILVCAPSNAAVHSWSSDLKKD